MNFIGKQAIVTGAGAGSGIAAALYPRQHMLIRHGWLIVGVDEVTCDLHAGERPVQLETGLREHGLETSKHSCTLRRYSCRCAWPYAVCLTSSRTPPMQQVY
jgi:hypothetical protein